MLGVQVQRVTYKADSGALAFKVKCEDNVMLSLSEKDHPHHELIGAKIGSAGCSMYCFEDKKNQSRNFNFGTRDFVGLWFSWNNSVYRLGLSGSEEPLVTLLQSERPKNQIIGFVTFIGNMDHWKYEAPPPPVRSISRKVTGGALIWRPLTGRQLPEDALIGGIEPNVTYIARAHHNGSLAPGKYVPGENAAFVAWGGDEHRKDDNIEILCGYNAEWVWTYGHRVPENSFIAGYSEVDHAPLYVGRAWVDGHLVTGKVHTLYKTCYLPYKGREVEAYKYEILVARHAEELGMGLPLKIAWRKIRVEF